VRLNRQHFDLEKLSECLGEETRLALTFENDIYSKARIKLARITILLQLSDFVKKCTLNKMILPIAMCSLIHLSHDLQFTAALPEKHALISVDLTHPATDRHVQKAEEQPLHFVSEGSGSQSCIAHIFAFQSLNSMMTSISRFATIALSTLVSALNKTSRLCNSDSDPYGPSLIFLKPLPMMHLRSERAPRYTGKRFCRLSWQSHRNAWPGCITSWRKR